MPYKLKIHHIDVGQGDATLILLKNYQVGRAEIVLAILIDGGASVATGTRVLDFCRRKLRVRKDRSAKIIDSIIISHFDRDHINGLPTVLDSELVSAETKYFSPKRALSENNESGYKRLIEAINRKNPLTVITELEPGGPYELGDLQVYCVAANTNVMRTAGDVVGPDQSDTDEYSGTIANQISLAFLFYLDGFLYYTGGDIGQTQERAIVECVGENRITAFKFSHHGSHSSSPDELFNTLSDPSVGFLSYGHNYYKHPHSEVLKRALKSGYLRRTYFTGQMDQYKLNYLLSLEPDERQIVVAVDSDMQLDKLSPVTGRFVAPGNYTIQKITGDPLFLVNYDRIGRAEEVFDSFSGTMIIFREKNVVPENTLYEIILSFIQHDMAFLVKYVTEIEGCALDLSKAISDRLAVTISTREELALFIQNHFAQLAETLDEDYCLNEEQVNTLTDRCCLRLNKVSAAETVSRKIRGYFRKDLEFNQITKMTDIYRQ